MDATYNYKDYSTKASFNAGSVIGLKADGVVEEGSSGTATVNFRPFAASLELRR